MINGFMVTGKDANGNIWLYSILKKKYWLAIEQALENDAYSDKTRVVR